MAKRYLEEAVLPTGSRGGMQDTHVAKHKQRNKALQIVFDPKLHK
jgi:hypothetical protein